MIPQHFPLYAIDARNAAVSVVIGWVETTDYRRLPVLAPAERPGPAVMIREGDAVHLVYSTQPRPIMPLPPVQRRPDADATVIQPTVQSGRLRP
jgi:hypothetical protein